MWKYIKGCFPNSISTDFYSDIYSFQQEWGISSAQKKTKYLVFQENLLELFQQCTSCQGKNIVTKNVKGTLVVVQMQCQSCGQTRIWKNQSCERGIPVLNIFLSAMMLLTRCWPTKTLRLFQYVLIFACSFLLTLLPDSFNTSFIVWKLFDFRNVE